MRTVFMSLVCTMLLAPAALAGEGGEGVQGSTPTEMARARDAAVDRGLLTSHAETIGKDQWAFNAYELFFVGITYGFTDDIQASLSTLIPVTTDIPLVLAIQPKFVLARTPDLVLSLRTPVTIVSSFEEDVDGTAGTVGAGLLLDYRLDAEGRFAFHAGLLASGLFGAGFDSVDGFTFAEGAVFELDVGMTFSLSNLVTLLVEVQSFAAAGSGGFDVADGVLLNYGIRFHSGSIAGDLGFIRPIGTGDDNFFLGVPYLAFSARF